MSLTRGKHRLILDRLKCTWSSCQCMKTDVRGSKGGDSQSPRQLRADENTRIFREEAICSIRYDLVRSFKAE